MHTISEESSFRMSESGSQVAYRLAPMTTMMELKTKEVSPMTNSEILRCPYSGSPLSVSEHHLHSAEHNYPIKDGIPNLVLDGQVAAIDEVFQRQYDEKTARLYDKALKTQSVLGGCWEPTQRRSMVRLLSPPQGGRVLEVAVGTGANLPFLSSALGPEGELFCVVKVAGKRFRLFPS